MKLLLTAIGKRVQLIKYLKKGFEVIGVDCSNNIAAKSFVDTFMITPRIDDPNYVDTLIDICHQNDIDILVPLYEKEFLLLDEYRDKFANIGTFLMLSNQNVIQICNDKWLTYKFMKDNRIDTPHSYIHKSQIPDAYPLIIKPRDGMGSQNIFIINDKEELDFYYKRVSNPIVQQFIEGDEYTIDCTCDVEGNPISVVPRKRLEVRSGEVSKTRICKHNDIIRQTELLSKKLKAIGPITIQCIETETDIKFIEINPRFGGGVPISIEAGIDYCGILKSIATEKKIIKQHNNFSEITMLRYDEAVYI